jgi:hypothetical protein
VNIITKHGLVSIVNRCNGYAVRASNPEAITAYCALPLIVKPDADYRYRVMMEPEELSQFVLKCTNDIDYDNFKNSIKDDTVHKLVYETWLSRTRLYG